MINPRRPRHDHVISANSRVVRNINRAVILNSIREREPISRATIARLTRLNKSTVSSIVASLLKENLIVEEFEKIAAVGRNPISLHLKRGQNLYGAISFDSAATRVAVVDVDGTILYTDKITSEPRPPEQFVRACVEGLVALRTKHSLPDFKGIGVSVAGIVDSMQSRVVFAPNLGWENVHIGDLLARAFPHATVTAVENDAKAAAIAELWFGRHKNIELSNFVFLSVGRGIGAGIVIDKHILNGEMHLAGEFGHMILFEGGELCACGNRGCWEAYASDRATVARYARAKSMDDDTARVLTIDDVIVAAKNGDGVAAEELRTSGRHLGTGIANVIKAVDPAAIIIGGHITRVWDLVSAEIIESARRHSFFSERGGTPILPTSLVRRPSLLGAAALAQRKFFGDLRVTV
ncbi:MAG TPA: ROK family transcriptional regulator [Bacteroidota bacterium]|nr:ROK family transcriptional regulator [Bacteroidota bacterium]